MNKADRLSIAHHFFPSPLCTPEPDGSCIQEVDITEGLMDFKVLVVEVDAEGQTQESVLSPFYGKRERDVGVG